MDRGYFEGLFLEILSETRRLTKKEASIEIGRCIKSIALKNNVKESEVYEIFYSIDFVYEGIVCSLPFPGPGKDSQENYSEEKCREMCTTVWFEGKCYPRFFENSKKINEDPDSFAKELSTPDLKNFLELAAYLYFNYEGGGLTDNSYDALEYLYLKRTKTRARKDDLKLLVGALPVPRMRVKLPHYMGSLPKAKLGDPILDVITSQPKVLVMAKEDGVSVMIVYSKGKPTKAYTRGDGVTGGNIDFILRYLNIPEKISTPELTVRGELVIARKVFEEKYSRVYSTPRSFVSSKVNSGYESQGLEDLRYVAYEIISPTSESNSHLEDQLKKLDLLGFEVVDHFTQTDVSLANLVKVYRDLRLTSRDDIDGIVLNPVSARSSFTNSSFSKVAFKPFLDEHTRYSKVTRVKWSPTRTGKIFPKIYYEAIYVLGKRYTKSTGHSAGKIRDWLVTKGASVKIVISGDTIPVIKEVKALEGVTEEDIVYPDSNLQWEWKGRDIYLTDPDSNPKVLKRRMLYFWKTLKTPGIGPKTVKKFYEVGYSDARSLIRVSQKQLQEIKGFGGKRGASIYESMHVTLQNSRFDRIITALGAMKGIGRSLLKEVTKIYPDFFFPGKTPKKLEEIKIKGLGPARIKELYKGGVIIKELFSGSAEFDIIIKKEKVRIKALESTPKNELLDGYSIVFTGFLGEPDFQLEDYIYDSGGRVSSSVASDTVAVVCRNPLEWSKKMESARENNIPILTAKEFIKRFNIPFGVSPEDEDL